MVSKVLELPIGNQADIAAVVEDTAETFLHQAEALNRLARTHDKSAYRQALTLMFNCIGHIIIIGMGKSGHVGRKISATLASTGTPSFFLHPAEAFHGDLGMVTERDVVLLISNSGETSEIVQLLPSLSTFGNQVIAITGKPDSTLGRYADVNLDIAVREESCPKNLVPTTSTTVSVAIGDALAVALMNLRDFQASDFAKYHPGGALGRRLLSRAKDMMISRKDVACVHEATVLLEIAAEMAGAKTDVAVVLDDSGIAIGLVKQEQLATALRVTRRLSEVTAKTIMLSDFQTVSENEILENMLGLFNADHMHCLLVDDVDGKFVGVMESIDQ